MILLLADATLLNNVSSPCTEENPDYYNNLAYSWQADFRAAHIYRELTLRDHHKYMIWLDIDAVILTKDWEKDPIQAMVNHDLVLLFDTFGYGSTKGKELKDKMEFGDI